MKQKEFNYLIFALLIIILLSILITKIDWLMLYSTTTTIIKPTTTSSLHPPYVNYYGYFIFNCVLNPNYPISTDELIITISGVAEREQGPKRVPYQVLKINDKYLFDAETKKPISKIQPLMNKELVIKGYTGKGDILGEKWWEEGHPVFVVKTVDAIYVTEIVDWNNVCCNICCNVESPYYSTLKECFWYDKDINELP